MVHCHFEPQGFPRRFRTTGAVRGYVAATLTRHDRLEIARFQRDFEAGIETAAMHPWIVWVPTPAMRLARVSVQSNHHR